MKITSVTPILNVSDVPASILWFESLGWGRMFTWNDGGMIPGAGLHNAHGPAGFGGLCMPSGDPHADNPGAPQLFLCHDGQGARDPHTPTDPEADTFGAVWMSWWVDDVDAAHAECVARGVEIVRPPKNEPWRVREFLIRHPDGHCFRVSGHM